ncbi:ribosomal RNA small subunit methyltransferase, mitochondrial [Mercurialis annua]|uniref:ribosomal RNA small subunit methyltransferase, mitochondrial n=1 Tax=Mercurialis annua TaxID=3986 RepID=UPI00215E7439|nr:ribosomal RNA small subunit methyltransferase, mitochondrial [Mercurialis annua]XP_050226698.1 ribosomal RNA small subunit methyltransferase, mitochondrial [Mercurialis annua]
MNLVFLNNKQRISKPKLIPFHLIYSVSFSCHQHFNKTEPTRSSSYADHNTNNNEDKSSEDKLHLCKSKGQHLLTNPRILDTIVTKSAVKCTDTVLEIGPGTGNLTLRLLQAARKVVAVEIDKRMVEILNRRVSEHGFQEKLDVVREDALKVKFPEFDIVVANIPYGISSPLVTKLVYGVNKYRSLTLLLQKEFARRLLAKPGDSEYNRLAVNVKLVADVEFVMNVSKRDFVPCPKVDSSVVIIRPKNSDDVPDVNFDEWKAFTRTCFSNKNKTLGAIFKQKKKVMELERLSMIKGCNSEKEINTDDKDDDNEESDGEDSHIISCSEMKLSSYKKMIIGVLESNGFEGKRPTKMSNEELLKLLSLFNQAGVYFHGQASESKVD